MKLTDYFISFLLQVLLFSKKAEPQTPTIAAAPSARVYVVEGEGVTLEWTYDLHGIAFRKALFTTQGVLFIVEKSNSDPAPLIRSEYRGRITANVTEIYSSITFLSVNKTTDSKIYDFSVQNANGDSATSTVEIMVQNPADITHTSDNQTVNQNDTVTLNCTADGYPAPNVTWTRNNSVITFPLNITGKHDEGAYRCTANNGIREPDTADVFIFVQNFGPIHTNLTTNVSGSTILINEGINLACSAMASPPPKYELYREQQSLVTSSNGSSNFVHPTRVSERIDQVIFSCTPFNHYGYGPTDTVTVTVLYPPEIVTPPSPEQKIEGKEVTLFCNATGNPQPNITWTKEGSNTIRSSTNTLILTNLTRGDNGVYICKAQNSLGRAEANATITVLYEPNVTIQQCSTTVTEGENVTLYCNATGNPAPSVAWIKPSPGEAALYSKMLAIDAIKQNESGNYSCLAWNGVGDNSTKLCEIDVQYPPEIVTPPLPEHKIEGKDVTLFCNATGNPQPNIAWTKEGSKTIRSSTNTLILTNLTRGDNGVYICKAQNSLGQAEANATITVLYEPNVTIQQCYTTVTEGENVTLYCNATGNPAPSVAWIKPSPGEAALYSKMLAIDAIKQNESGNYSCLAWNEIGDNSTKLCEIDVQYPPEIVTPPLPQQKIEGKDVTLFCNATGNPQPNITWTKEGSNTIRSSTNTLTLTNPMRGDNGVYICKAQNSLGQAEANATITVLYESNVTIQQCSTTVTEGENVTLNCNATGNPAPSVAWIKPSPGQAALYSKMLVIEAIKWNESGNYSCLAWNEIGDNSTKLCRIDVQYPPVITKPPSRLEVNASETTIIECLAEANPTAKYVWRKVSGEFVSSDSYFHFNDVNDGNYTCTATNDLSSTNRTVLVEVKVSQRSLQVTVLNADYDNLESAFVDNFEQVVEETCTTISKKCTANVTGLGGGSVIVFFNLFFTPPVTTSVGLAELRAAVNNGSIGPYLVTALKIIQQFEPTSTATTSTALTTLSASPTGTTTTAETTTPSSDGPPWVVIGAVIGGVVVFAIIVAVVTWCVHKKRKCRRKDAKIHHSESEEQQAFSRQEGQLGAEDNAYSQVNHDYAGTGPRSNGTETVALQQRAAADGSDAAAHQQEAAASPTYAEVDKSEKKKKKEEEKLSYTNAEVDGSKKTKKKPKPGEMIYADLEDTNVLRPMPTVSTSPQPLPPIKRPEPYENTQYADITQFLKGDATLPKDDGNQGTELQLQGANKDEGGAGGDRNTPM